MRWRRGVLGFVVLASTLHAGCFGSGVGSGGCDAGSLSSGDAGCLLFCFDSNDCPNPATPPRGKVHGIRSDGRVDVTAAEAWPRRAEPEVPPSAQEVAEACSALSACADPVMLLGNAQTSVFDLPTPGLVDAFCRDGTVVPNPFAINAAERVIPIESFYESWPFLIHAVAALHGDCAAIRKC